MKIAVLDIGGTAVKYALYTPGQEPKVCEQPTCAQQGAPALLEALHRLLAELGRFDCVAVSTAGQVDTAAGTILYASDNLPGYTGTPLAQLIQGWFSVPAFVENDVNAAALGEARFGAGRGAADFLCLTYGTGIGGAIVQQGHILHGSTCAAGEFGHILTHAGGRPCTCGGHGCYEAYASTGAMVRAAEQQTGLHRSGREIFAQRERDPQLEQVVSAWIDEILWGLVSLVHAFNPERILLGGGVMEQPYLQEELRRRLPPLLMPNHRGVCLCRAALGNRAGIYGAAALALAGMEQGKKQAAR